jgi:hypothetical protein
VAGSSFSAGRQSGTCSPIHLNFRRNLNACTIVYGAGNKGSPDRSVDGVPEMTQDRCVLKNAYFHVLLRRMVESAKIADLTD